MRIPSSRTVVRKRPELADLVLEVSTTCAWGRVATRPNAVAGNDAPDSGYRVRPIALADQAARLLRRSHP